MALNIAGAKDEACRSAEFNTIPSAVLAVGSESPLILAMCAMRTFSISVALLGLMLRNPINLPHAFRFVTAGPSPNSPDLRFNVKRC